MKFKGQAKMDLGCHTQVTRRILIAGEARKKTENFSHSRLKEWLGSPSGLNMNICLKAFPKNKN